MEIIDDDYIISLVKVGEVMDRIDRERPELSQEDREAVTVRLGQQELALALASRSDLATRFDNIAKEHFLRAIARQVRSPRSA